MKSFNLSNARKRGFTLIELLVVIAIIGILSSVVLASLNAARIKARDARRQSDLHQIQLGLSLYYEANGTYPSSPSWAYSCNSTWNTLNTALAPYMPSVPVDPVNGPSCNGPWSNGYYTYAYSSVGTTEYDLVGQFENTSNPQRCAVRQWFYRNGNTSWCGIYSQNLVADH